MTYQNNNPSNANKQQKSIGNNYKSTQNYLHFTAMNCKVNNKLKKCEEIQFNAIC
jgi:hypothetical protein